MSKKEEFVQTWENEYPTTLKVLKAFPTGKAGFRPHEKSQNALRLAWNFVQAQVAVRQVLDGTFKIPPEFPKEPERWEDVVSSYEAGHKQLMERLKKVEDSELLETMNFPVGPEEWKEIPKIKFLWFVLCDGIHHRGQLSVYIRMAGGKVPSIYGPSGDEPWN